MMSATFRVAAIALLLAPALFRPVLAQAPQAPVPSKPATPSPVERLGKDLYRVGNVRVDVAKREVSVPGFVTTARTLEFVATTKGGFKSYESAVELDTNGVTFNVALLLIGLDPANATPPKVHLDPATPKGDPVEIWVEWEQDGKKRRIPGEELVFNQESKKTLSGGPWVYTGSVINTESNMLQADLDGVLIGFVHSPAALIDHPASRVGPYSANQINPALDMKPRTPITLTVHALPVDKK